MGSSSSKTSNNNDWQIAEQKAAKVMVDTWNVRRTTDPDSAAADSTNNLNDAAVGRAVTKLLSGVGA